MTTENKNENKNDEKNWDDGALIVTEFSDEFRMMSLEARTKIDDLLADLQGVMTGAYAQNVAARLVDSFLKSICNDYDIAFKKTISVHYEFARKDDIPDEWKAQKDVAKIIKD